jgi:hypothetical protein
MAAAGVREVGGSAKSWPESYDQLRRSTSLAQPESLIWTSDNCGTMGVLVSTTSSSIICQRDIACVKQKGPEAFWLSDPF